MTGPADAARSPELVWTASAVARRLGVAPGTLRSWTRRHGIGPASHSMGRHRRYTAADVAELEAIRNLVDEGVALSAAADLVLRQRRPAVVPAGSVPSRDASGDPVSDLAAAATRLDADAAAGIVMAELDGRGVLVVWEELCRPALGVLDTTVGDDAECADAHLLLSWVLTTCLRTRPAPPGDRPVLLAGAPGEQHTLGLEVLHAALAERGVPTRMLGPDVPAAAVQHAAARLHPRTVVIWAQRASTAEPSAVATLSAHCDHVLAAGPGWDRSGGLPVQVTRVDSLPAALALAATPVGHRARTGSAGAAVAAAPR